MVDEQTRKLLSTIKYYLTQKESSFVSQRLQLIRSGKIPKWKIELLGYIQIWNTGHKNDLIEVKNSDMINEKALLARVAVLEKKFSK